jgi:hypothetical protein
MIELTVQLTQDQYDRFKAAMTTMQQMEEPATDDMLVAQMKREAAAITYAAEVGSGDGSEWSY